MTSDDGLAWVREEWRDARDAQSHLPHPPDCGCSGCVRDRYEPEDQR